MNARSFHKHPNQPCCPHACPTAPPILMPTHSNGNSTHCPKQLWFGNSSFAWREHQCSSHKPNHIKFPFEAANLYHSSFTHIFPFPPHPYIYQKLDVLVPGIIFLEGKCWSMVAVGGNLPHHLQWQIMDFHLQPTREIYNECLVTNIFFLFGFHWKKQKHTQKYDAYQLDVLYCFSWVSLLWDPSHSREVLIPSQTGQQHTSTQHNAQQCTEREAQGEKEKSPPVLESSGSQLPWWGGHVYRNKDLWITVASYVIPWSSVAGKRRNLVCMDWVQLFCCALFNRRSAHAVWNISSDISWYFTSQ